MHVACVLIDHLPFKLEMERDPGLRQRKAVIFQRQGSRRVVLDASPAAKAVLPGMSLQEALARCKDAVPIEADSARYEQEFNNVVLRLGYRSPVVETAGLSCAYVSLDGLQDTYGSEERLFELLLQAVPSYLGSRVGASEGKFPAYLAALSAQPGRVHRTPHNVRDFVAPWSIDMLPLEWAIKVRLHGFGLNTLGQVAERPIGPIQAQFGKVGAMLWLLSQGVDDTPLIPHRVEEELQESLTLPTPTVEITTLLIAVDNLLGRIFARPEMRGRYARISLLEGTVYNKPSWHRRIVFKTPAGERRHALFVIKSSLEGMALPGPLEDVSLTLKELTGEAGLQGNLFQDIRRRDQLRQAIAQLKASQGKNPIYEVREVEPWSRIPERRRALVTYDP
ncbi:MAG: DNA polymerase Y family protein [Dehalococcoidia bacterium]|nr:DNA polymerase Y family protein [Dehalococcoidia bacterium]